MENTEESEINIEDIGTILKSSRLKQKKTMEEISTELCIRKIYLIALEEGDYDTLPPIPYGTGYVRTYARYLGLNPERAVKLYKAASVVEENEADAVQEKTETNKSSSRHIIVGVLALAMIYAGWSLYTVYQQSKELPPASDNAFLEETSFIESQEENVSDIATPEDAAQNETAEDATSALPVSEVAEAPAEETPAPVEEPAPVVDNDIVLEFVGESWVELKGKNKVYVQGVYHQGDKRKISYVDNVYLSVGRPENVKVFIKGVEKNILIKRRKMNIPLDSLD